MYIFHIYPYVYGSLHIVVIVIDSVLDSHAKKKAHYTSHCVLLKTASSSSLQKKVVSKSPLVSSEEKMSHNVTRLQSASGEKNMGRTETDYQILESSVSMQAKMRQKGIGNTLSSYYDGGTRGFRRYFNGQTRSIELAQLFETQRHKDALSTIRRGLLLLFHPLLASKISWKGYNNNFKFEDTKTAQILCGK
ncbi:PREDICTED: uncharacterized protein LOC108764087 isoform X1 [Trachymyrmex cornetzi]|uniref:uncharacterized protein LOC108764087 isoform X1 n=1 Tax=Trachymyrmex cornetzi TaxID=471704 RepID=UPI00084ED1F2|nr:PREDICTED: uncharacterized protein LOC108764087 isoform X1 [Trachymyrmex cornetzi]